MFGCAIDSKSWTRPPLPHNNSVYSPRTTPPPPPTMQPSQAVSALFDSEEREDRPSLVKRVKGHATTRHDGIKTSVETNQLVIPLHARVGVEQDLDDNGLLPEEPDMEQYSDVPVESYGLALLRGMGFSDQDKVIGVGERATRVEPVVLNARPALLGLGAKPKLLDAQSQRPGGRTFLTIGSLLRVVAGPPASLRGKFVVAIQTDGVPGMNKVRVESLNSDTNEWEEYIVSRNDVEIIPVASLSKGQHGYDLYVAHEKRMADKATTKTVPPAPPPPSHPNNTTPEMWIREGLIVKIVDKDHRYFKRKGVIVTVTDRARKSCSIRLLPEEGSSSSSSSVVELELRQKMLQTVIPKRNGKVTVLKDQSWSTGEVVDLDPARTRALVKLQDGTKATWFNYDGICACVAIGDE